MHYAIKAERGNIMKSYVLALAALAAIGFAGAAFAEDGKTSAPTAMSDAQMDQVTAGDEPESKGTGTLICGTACLASEGRERPSGEGLAHGRGTLNH